MPYKYKSFALLQIILLCDNYQNSWRRLYIYMWKIHECLILILGCKSCLCALFMPLCVISLINATARFTDCKETCLVRGQQKLFVRDGENDLFCCFLVSLFWQPIYKQEERSLILLQKEFSKVNMLYIYIYIWFTLTEVLEQLYKITLGEERNHFFLFTILLLIQFMPSWKTKKCLNV